VKVARILCRSVHLCYISVTLKLWASFSVMQSHCAVIGWTLGNAPSGQACSFQLLIEFPLHVKTSPLILFYKRKTQNISQILKGCVGEHEGKRPFERSRFTCRWENNIRMYEGVSKSFRTESSTKWAKINTRWEATQKAMAVKLTKLAHRIVIQLHLVAESCTICSSLQTVSPKTFGYTIVS
jgi:hypothetical protein